MKTLRIATHKDSQEKRDFAKMALEHFYKYPDDCTFTKSKVSANCLFAVRWGLGDDCALIFQIGKETPIIYDETMFNEEEGLDSVQTKINKVDYRKLWL